MVVGALCNKATMFSMVIKKDCVHCECYITADSAGGVTVKGPHNGWYSCSDGMSDEYSGSLLFFPLNVRNIRFKIMCLANCQVVCVVLCLVPDWFHNIEVALILVE
jgi:hypothetical protein